MTNPTEHNLTQKQFLFCEHLIQTRNGTKAARLAGYKGDDNALASIASQNLRKPKVQAYLSKRYKETAMDSDEVLSLLAKIARASVSDYCDENGTIDWKKVAADGYSIKAVMKAKLEFEGKLRALELIGRAHAMFTDKIAPTDPTGTKEFGADTRSDLISKLLPGLAASATTGGSEEADD